MTPCLKIRYRGNHFAANYKREGLISRGDDAPVEMSVLDAPGLSIGSPSKAQICILSIKC
jgi:hypothetical protein